ncbi:hypothetical protein [Tessaracoccus sp. Y1736]
MSRAWPTMAEVADAVSRELAVGDIDMAHRLVMDGVNRLPAAAEAGLLSHVLEPPPSTGDQRWDALLAAAVRYRLHGLGRQAPEWTVKEPLNVFWWPTRISASQQYNAMAHTPAEFRRLGIFIDERDLTSA